MTISVITVNRNNTVGLRATIESVIAQTEPPFEFIIIDGASTDGGAELLKEYASHITYSVSEPDKGIYNAMNKGVAASHGDYCLFLNSGDAFCSKEVLAQMQDSGAKADIICGNAIILEEPRRKKTAPEAVTLRFLYGTALCHQAVFIRTELLRKYPYDETLKIVADRKFFLQSLILDNCSYEAVPVDVCNYDVTGFSAKNRFASAQEWQAVLNQMLPERILLDYGREAEGALYGTSDYERLFLEIGRRRWKKPVYRLVKSFLQFMALFVPSARFVRGI